MTCILRNLGIGYKASEVQVILNRHASVSSKLNKMWFKQNTYMKGIYAKSVMFLPFVKTQVFQRLKNNLHGSSIATVI